MSSGPVFNPMRPVTDQPYQIIDKNDKSYNKSWKTTANQTNSSTYKEISKYYDEIDKEVNKFQKKAYKNISNKRGVK